LVAALSTGGWVHSINIQFSNPESRSAPMRCGFFNGGCVFGSGITRPERHPS
jgi:hypothetical protein